jgi:hypothetical protein
MRLGWRRVAERGDNRAFAPDEISKAIIPALEQDCRAEMNSEFLHDICAVFQEQDASLFKDDVKPKIEALRSKAGCGIGRTLLDNVIQISASDAAGIAALNQSHDRRFGRSRGSVRPPMRGTLLAQANRPTREQRSRKI